MKVLITALFAAVPFFAQAADFDVTGGVGFQFWGVIGTQLSLHDERHRGRLGLGLIGFNAGYDYKFARKWSLGASAGKIVTSFDTPTLSMVSLTHHFSGDYSKGWMFAIDAMLLSDVDDCSEKTSSGLCLNEDDTGLGAFFSVGYTF